MKVIVLWQPWASLVALGAKIYETRGFPTQYRGPLVICAAKRAPILEKDVGFDVAIQIKQQLTNHDLVIEDLPLGAALCVVDVVDCIEGPAVPSCDRLFGDYAPGRFAWRLKNIRPFRNPPPVLGRQGFFNINDDQVEKALRG